MAKTKSQNGKDAGEEDGHGVKKQKVEHKKKGGAHKSTHHAKKGDAKHDAKGGKKEEEEEDAEPMDEDQEQEQKEEQDEEQEQKGEQDEEAEKLYDRVLECLEKELSLEEVREMLEANGVDSSGEEDAVVERCADQMVYGPLERCPVCEGGMEFARTEYRCLGFVSVWAKCNYTTKEARRKKEAWKVPEDVKKKSKFLREWEKSQDPGKRPVRKLETMEKPLEGITLMLAGRLSKPQYVWRQEVEKYGGKVAKRVGKDLDCVVTGRGDLEGGSSEKVAEAVDLGIPIVREDWLMHCIEKKKRLPFEDYDLRAELPSLLGLPPEALGADGNEPLPLMAELKVAGKRSVHKDSELEEEGGKIFEKDGIIYNCCFTLCDQALNVNDYVCHQLVVMPSGELYLYYKSGRIGRRKPKDERLDVMSSKKKGIREFVKIFENLTGNPFEPWEREKKFEKKVMKFSPIDVFVGVEVRAGALRVRQVGPAALHCKLDPRVKAYLKVLFSEETYRFCMEEMAINPPDSPDGNVTDFQVARCQDAVLQFVDYMKQPKHDFTHEQKCLSFSNRIYSLIPSPHPFVARTMEDIADVVAIAADSVRDISIASQVIGDMTGATIDDHMSEGYQRMGCKMTPLDRSGEVYKTIFKYLSNTFEPLKFQDGEFGVVLEDVVQIDSESPNVPKLEDLADVPNKVLLWCGARTCNMVRWLKYGPPKSLFDAPVPGYLFGRGYYCYDSAAKAAMYGFTAVDRPEGMVVLSVVGLGDNNVELPKPEKDVKEYENEDIGVKALGRKQPDPKQSTTMKLDDKVEVTVPLGKLKKVEDSDDMLLDYNEYVVYDAKRVKPHFLCRIRFAVVE